MRVPRDSHFPEQAQLAWPAVEARTPAPWPSPSVGEPPLRPLFLFDPPQAVEVIAEVPDGPPHRFRWKRKLHEVRLFEGPERIASEWWKRPASSLPVPYTHLTLPTNLPLLNDYLSVHSSISKN